MNDLRGPKQPLRLSGRMVALPAELVFDPQLVTVDLAVALHLAALHLDGDWECVTSAAEVQHRSGIERDLIDRALRRLRAAGWIDFNDGHGYRVHRLLWREPVALAVVPRPDEEGGAP